MALRCGNNQIPVFPVGIAVDKRGDNVLAAIVNAFVNATAAVARAQASVRQEIANAGNCPRQCPVKSEGDPTFDLTRFQIAFDAAEGEWRCAITGTVAAVVTCETRKPKPKPKVEA